MTKTYIFSVVTAVLSLLTLIILIKKNKSLPKSVKNSFYFASALIIACTVTEFAELAMDAFSEKLWALHAFFKFAEHCLTPLIPLALATLFLPARSRRVVFIPNIVHIVLETVSLFTGFIFYIDSGNVCRHGDFYWIYYCFVYLNVLFLVWVSIEDCARLQNRNFLSLFTILIFILAGTVFQVTDSEVNIVWLTVAIGAILFYIYYCNMVYQLDALTGLLNRRAYELHKSALKRRSVILFFDVNEFKQINDRFGHDSGDACLRFAASAIRSVYGRYGPCYRIGGDEFCVIVDRKVGSCNISELNAKFAAHIAEKSGLMHSIAIGSAVFEPGKTDIDEAVKRADEEMYSEKNRAKNSEK